MVDGTLPNVVDGATRPRARQEERRLTASARARVRSCSRGRGRRCYRRRRGRRIRMLVDIVHELKFKFSPVPCLSYDSKQIINYYSFEIKKN